MSDEIIKVHITLQMSPDEYKALLTKSMEHGLEVDALIHAVIRSWMKSAPESKIIASSR